MNYRVYFSLTIFGIPFLSLLIFAFLGIVGFPMFFCLIVLIIGLLLGSKKMHKLRCPKCNEKVINFFIPGKKYYQGLFLKFPYKCPCCGFDFEKN